MTTRVEVRKMSSTVGRMSACKTGSKDVCIQILVLGNHVIKFKSPILLTTPLILKEPIILYFRRPSCIPLIIIIIIIVNNNM